ncbi:D-glycero-alpha-D-manno-heptose-1,7-bisphosphate 7-phosphatase [Peribacillus sp. SCS-37]|uniref:D-glycero-alpha-D-manno-heptose-1,7-bisphosphate 7-phosphatase n=1 Tax=Paraperibacillus esterisolvens TaxID=3115296 RepID=UPI003906203B
MEKAIFLDRDGVINEVLTKRVKFVNNPGQLFLLEGAAEAIARFSSQGYKVFIVTNQGGVGLGYLKEKALVKIHDQLKKMLAEQGGTITDISYCAHRPDAGCECRKPGAGLLLDLAERYDVDLAGSVMAGDHERDIQAGKKAGCKTVFIGQEPTEADASAPSLKEAADIILKLLA